MTTFLQDLRFGFHMLVKNPAFTAMAVLSLALGIGANAAIFSLLDAILLKQLPVKQPQELYFVQYGEPGFKPTSNVSFTAFEQLKTHESISAACFFNYTTRINVSSAGSSEVVEGRTLEDQVDESLGQERLVTALASLFGALAIVLASLGLYGVMSYAVSQSTHEIGIRMALGAQQSHVLGLVVKN